MAAERPMRGLGYRSNVSDVSQARIASPYALANSCRTRSSRRVYRRAHLKRWATSSISLPQIASAARIARAFQGVMPAASAPAWPAVPWRVGCRLQGGRRLFSWRPQQAFDPRGGRAPAPSPLPL